MKKTLFAAAAFALALVPAIASAETAFDPGADNASPTFVQPPVQVNPANAAAAAADAQRYATVADGAVVGTHGGSPTTVLEYDPGAPDGVSAFRPTVILPGSKPLPAQQHYTPYADNSELIGW